MTTKLRFTLELDGFARCPDLAPYLEALLDSIGFFADNLHDTTGCVSPGRVMMERMADSASVEAVQSSRDVDPERMCAACGKWVRKSAYTRTRPGLGVCHSCAIVHKFDSNTTRPADYALVAWCPTLRISQAILPTVDVDDLCRQVMGCKNFLAWADSLTESDAYTAIMDTVYEVLEFSIFSEFGGAAVPSDLEWVLSDMAAKITDAVAP